MKSDLELQKAVTIIKSTLELNKYNKIIENNITITLFFRNVPNPDEQCLRAQSILHPVCAQQPDPLPDESPLSCHEIARSCKESPDCR